MTERKKSNTRSTKAASSPRTRSKTARSTAARREPQAPSKSPRQLDRESARRLLRAMEQELTRQIRGLRHPGEPAPFFRARPSSGNHRHCRERIA